MSGNWETVGKQRKSKAATAAAAKTEEKSLKIEDILPQHQIQSLYGSTPKTNVAIVNNNNSSKNVVQSRKSSPSTVPAAATGAKVKCVSAPSRSKSKNNADPGVVSLNVAELQDLLCTYQSSFPDSHLVWLKMIVAFLNKYESRVAKIVSAASNFPSSVLPAEATTLIYRTLLGAGIVNVQYFFDQSLTSLAVDMSNNLPCIGHKIMLQLIAIEWPHVCGQSLAKNAILRNSYQNRAPIGLSVLWALGEGGFRDITVGLRVWRNIMVPVLSIKAYTKFVCDYVGRVLQSRESGVITGMLPDEFMDVFDEMMLERPGIANECRLMLERSAAELLQRYVQSTSKVTNLFLILFRRVEATSHKSHACILDGIVRLLNEADCFTAWKLNFRKNVIETNAVLRHIVKTSSAHDIVGSSSFSTFLESMQAIVDNYPPRKLDQDVNETGHLIKTLQDKSAAQKKNNKSSGSASSSLCPWLFGSFAVFILISGLLAYDTHANGGGVFAKSATGKFFGQTGVLPYVEVAWTKSMSSSARGFQWAEKHVPVYVNTVGTALRPYGDFLRDLAIVGWNSARKSFDLLCECVRQKTPIVVKFIEQYVPGLPQKIQDASVTLWTNVCSTSSAVYASSSEFFKTKVFVGNLSPENLNKALNQTQIAAAQYYSWFHQKVDTYAKIQ